MPAVSVGHSAFREATEHLERSLEALSHLPKTRETIEQAIDVRLDLRSTVLITSRPSLLLIHLREAETLAQGLNDRKRLGWVSAYMTSYLWRVADNEQALEYGWRAAAIASEIGDPGLRATTNAC